MLICPLCKEREAARNNAYEHGLKGEPFAVALSHPDYAELTESYKTGRVQRKTVSVCDAAPNSLYESQQKPKPPVYSGHYEGTWSVRVYESNGEYEACFFHVDLWHEHVRATTLEGALTLAHETINKRIAEGK